MKKGQEIYNNYPITNVEHFELDEWYWDDETKCYFKVNPRSFDFIVRLDGTLPDKGRFYKYEVKGVNND